MIARDVKKDDLLMIGEFEAALVLADAEKMPGGQVRIKTDTAGYRGYGQMAHVVVLRNGKKV